jgi:hypothetical protein
LLHVAIFTVVKLENVPLLEHVASAITLFMMRNENTSSLRQPFLRGFVLPIELMEVVKMKMHIVAPT